MEEKATILMRNRNKSSWTESFLVKYFLKGILGLVTILVFLTLVQCTVEKPESPSWTTDLNVPVVDRTYDMSEILNKINEPSLSLDSSGEVMFSVSEELDTVTLDQDPTLDDMTDRMTAAVGEITLRPDNPTPLDYDLSDYVTLPLGMVPEASFDLDFNIPPRPDYLWADVTSGAIRVHVTNDFGTDLDTVIVTIYDLIGGAPVVSGQFPDPGIMTGTTDALTLPLANQRISNQLRVEIHCHTPGGSPSPQADYAVTLGLDFDEGIMVTAAEAEIPELSLDYVETVTLPGSGTVQSGELTAGMIELNLENWSNLPVTLDITLPDFTVAGTPLSVTRQIDAGVNDSIQIDISGYTLEPLDQEGTQELSLDINATVDETTSPVTVRAEDSIVVGYEISGLALGSLTGIVDPIEVPIDSITVDIDVPQGFDSLRLVDAVLTIEVTNAFDCPGSLVATMAGNNGRLIGISGIIAAGTFTDPVVSTFTDTNLARFLDPIPSVITINGTAVMGDGISPGTISPMDYLVPRVSINAPLELVMEQTSFDGDMSSEDLSSENLSVVTDHVVEALFTGLVTNHLPLGATVELYLDGDPDHLTAELAEVIIGPIEVSAGIIESGTTVTLPSESNIQMALDSTQVAVLENDMLYCGQRITLHSTDGQTVKVTGSDYIAIQGLISLVYRFDGQF